MFKQRQMPQGVEEDSPSNAARKGNSVKLEIEFHDNGQRGLYAADYEGHRAKMTFVHEAENIIAADHTYVPPEIEGHGVAAALVSHAVEDARAKGWKIRPACSYVVAAFEKHPEWADVRAG